VTHRIPAAKDFAVANYRGAAGNSLIASEVGSGLPVLFLHGGGQTRHAWDNTMRRVARAGFAGIAVDLRGHGDSEWIADGSYTFSDFAADALALADAIAAKTGARPVAVGASLGGIASLLALGRNGDAFAGLVLVDVTPHMERSGVDHIQNFMRARAAEGFATIAEAADAVAAYLPHRPRPKSLDGLRKNLRHHPDGRWRWHWDPRFLDGPRHVEAGYERVLAAKEEAARALGIPTLLVRGRSSELVSEDSVEKFRLLAPAAEYADIAGARHMVAGDRNDVFGDTIVDFLTRQFGKQA
jgi:pimeloyl-ACP methyl ester carboxylesterase